MMKNLKPKLTTKFKKYSESTSSNYREEMGIPFYSKIDALELAKYLKIPIVPITALKGLSTNELNHLIGKNGIKVEWHALTTRIQGTTFIVHNDSNIDVRQQSDIFHELAHIICGHTHEESENLNNFNFLRNYNPIYEEEARYLGAALHIPFGGLIASLKKNKSQEEIAWQYNCSIDLVKYRIYSSGAGGIVARIKNKINKY